LRRTGFLYSIRETTIANQRVSLCHRAPGIAWRGPLPGSLLDMRVRHATILLCATTACSTTNGARGSTDAALAADGAGGDDAEADGGSNGVPCMGGGSLSPGPPLPPCGTDQICCVLDITTACLARAMGCPGTQLCTTTAECVVPGDICAFPPFAGPVAESCMPAPDDGGITGGSDGATEASMVDGAAVNADGARDAASSSDVATDAPVE
jgi:hypothetical protein